MRPVTRGAIPNGPDGQPRQFASYGDAGPELQKRLGDYCSYCERQIETHLAVEHIRPKKPGGAAHPGRLLDWDNFLLGCVHCNSRKGDTDVELADYLWPDTDNTFRAIEFSEGGLVAAANLGPVLKPKAEAMIRLVGLDVDPGNPNRRRRPSESDKRWLKRREIWRLAIFARQRLARRDFPEMREQIVDTALGRGMFSIWMKIFEHDADMRRRFIEAFAGTARNCFDHEWQAVPRPGGQC